MTSANNSNIKSDSTVTNEKPAYPWYRNLYYYFRHHICDHPFEFILAIATVVLAYYTYQLWGATHDLLVDAQATSEKREQEVNKSTALAASAVAATQAVADAATKQWQIADNGFRESQRAWVGPVLASFESEPMTGKSVPIDIVYQNTGREPAFNASSDVYVESISVPVEKAHEKEWRKMLDDCTSAKTHAGGQVIYPNNNGGAFSTYNLKYTSNATLIDDAVIKGNKLILVQGCFRYTSMGMQRHSFFCFFYKAGKTKYQSLGFCPASNYAD